MGNTCCTTNNASTPGPLDVKAQQPVPAASKALEDGTVTLAPYFVVHDKDKFCSIWRADFAHFQHKDDCVHYAFTFSEDGRAHCREAYHDAKAVLQHLADVDTPLNAVLDPAVAQLEKLEVHGPASELELLRDALSPLGAKFFACEWGFRPAHAAMEEDSVVHLYPYFKMQAENQFKAIWKGAYESTKAAAAAEKSHQYAFSFDGDMASCREAYGDAEGVLLHLKNVDTPLNAVLNGPAELDHIEVHGPAAELEKLRPALGPLGAQFFTTGWGFRNATPSKAAPAASA